MGFLKPSHLMHLKLNRQKIRIAQWLLSTNQQLKLCMFSFLLKNTSSLDELWMVKNKVFESKRISNV